LETITEILRRPALEPDPTRTDWGSWSKVLDELLATATTELAEPLDAALAELEDDAQKRENVRLVVADRLGDAAGLLLAAGRPRDGRTLINRALALGSRGAGADLLAAGLADPDRFVQVIRAWWLVNQKRRKEALVLARAAMQGAPAAIAGALQPILDAPMPIDSAPALFGINGFGLRVYGERDRTPDGSYVTTRYITALFVPLLPVDAYRVVPAEQGWYFIGKERLSGVHRWWQRVALLGIVVAVLGGMLHSYLTSEGRRLELAIEAAQAAEAAAGPDERAAVIDQYEAILNDFPEAGPQALGPVIEAFVRLSAAEVASPLTVEHLADVKRIVLRYRALPEVARHQLVVGPIVAQLERWAEELGSEGNEEILGAIELYGQAEALATPTAVDGIRERRHALNRQLAAALAADWPLEAVRQYTAMPGDHDAVVAAGELLLSLGEGPSVWIELGPTIDRWQQAAIELPALESTRAEVRERLAAAHERVAATERVALLDEPEAEALKAALEASPGDQELAVALADLRLAAGDTEGALAVLTTLGSPGRMVLAAQASLATTYAESGREPEADALLERVLTSRLPAFESAQRAYSERADALTERLIERGRRGELPYELTRKLELASEPEQQQIFGEWLEEQIDRDVELSGLRDEYVALTGVVGIAIQWGTLKLRRANAEEGAARQELLDGAERAFLAIGREASGIPSYHLGLGQVYYRMGKEEEGERELQSLLDDEPPQIQLEVAKVYRELGLVARAREVAGRVFETAESPFKEGAAVSMALMAEDREESRTWLGRADQSNPTVRLRVIEYDAYDLLEKGEYAAADAKLAEVAAGWVEQSKHDASASNNAALSMLTRYSCTGEPERLREAVRLLDKARSLAPDNALVVGNLGSAIDMLASVELLEAFLRPEPLRLSGSEIDELIGALAEGPHGARLREAMAESQSLRRALELIRQDQVLGPKNAQPYDSLLRWHMRRRDEKALAELGRLLESTEVDLSARAAAIASRLDGSDLAKDLEGLDQRLARYDGLAKAVDATGHRPTQAALRWLRGEAQLTRAYIGRDPKVAREAVATLASAGERWEGLGHESHARALVELALLEAMQGSPALAELYGKERLRLGGEGLIARLLEGDGETLAALRSRPELGEALALRKGLADEQLRPFDWLLARLVGDAELQARSLACLELPEVRARFELGARLSPEPEAGELVRRMMQAAR
jgi:hypothetical protein